MLIRHSVPGFAHRVYQTSAALIVPMFDAFVPRHRNVLAVLGTPDGRLLIPASNIVTTAGDVHYAQRGAAEAPTNAFAIAELASAGTPGKSATRSSFTPIASTQKAHAAGYPRTNDNDPDNTGAGTDIVTFLASYTKADFNHAAISHGLITNASPGASEPLLTGYAFAASFEKTSDDTLRVFVNHDFTGS
jgi:hypothetical protein